MRIQVAADHEAQAVGDEFPQVVVVAQLRIVLEERAPVGRVQVGLDGHEPFLADLHEHLVQKLQQCDVIVTAVFGTLHQGERLREGGLDDLQGIAGEERAQRGPHDDQDLGRVPQGQQLPALEHEAADHAEDNDDRADYLNHFDLPRITRAGRPHVPTSEPR